MKEILTTLSLIGAAQGYFLGLILFTRKNNILPNRILSALLFIMSFALSAQYLADMDAAVNWRIILPFLLSLMSLYGPLVYLYSKSIISGVRCFKLTNFLHLIPFLIIFFIYIFIWSYHSLETELKKTSAFGLLLILTQALIFFSGFVYTVQSIRLLRKHERHVSDFFSDIEKLNFKWLQILLSLLLILYVEINASTLLNFLAAINIFDIIIPQIFGTAMHVFVIFFISYYAIKQPEIFRKTVVMEKEIGCKTPGYMDVTLEAESTKYIKQSLDEITQKQYLGLLLDLMDSDKPYLDDQLTLKNLSDKLSVSSHHLSIVINNQLNKNFYNFISAYRIEEAKVLFEKDCNHDKNILQIAFEAGFNSKTTFNTVFKKNTGMTPSEYRKQLKV